MSRPSNLRSLRFRLPMLLLLYCSVVAVGLYVAIDRVQEGRFEQEFLSRQTIRATELQSRTERAAERSELETGQREFGELAALEEVRAAVLVSPDNRVLLTSRREWLNQLVDLPALGVDGPDLDTVTDAMRLARTSQGSQARFSSNRNGLVLVLPASLPLVPGALRVDRSAVIVLVFDMSLSKAVNRYHLQRQFGLVGVAFLLAAFGLGVGVHLFVTRRLERLEQRMRWFAAGESLADETPSRADDEIATIQNQFSSMATAIRREMGERRQVEAALRESESKFRDAMYYSPIGTALVALDGTRWLEANPALCAILGYSREEMLDAGGFLGITHPDDLAESIGFNRQMVAREIETFAVEKRYIHKSGRIVWAQLNTSLAFHNGEPAYFVSQIQDITERKRAEAELQRVNRALRTISHCSQALVHATDEQALLNEVCRVIVEDGGYRFAWVGLPVDVRSATIAATAHKGFEDGYLRVVKSVWESGRSTFGPTRSALRSGQPFVCRDYASDPNVAEWRDEALKRGYRSSVVFPLMNGGDTLGALLIYSGEANAFDEGEMALLGEMAEDLAYGLQALRTERKRHETELELVAQEALLHQLIRHTPAAVAMFDREMCYIAASESWISDYRLEGQDIIGKSHYEVIPDIPGHWKAIHRRVLDGAIERCDEDQFHRADGTTEWLQWELRPWHNADGTIGGLTMFTQAITERKRAETALRESQAKLVLAMDMAKLAPWELDVASATFQFNDTFYALLRTTAAAEGGMQMAADTYARKFIPPSEQHIVRDEMQRSLATTDPHYLRRLEHRVLRADGSVGVLLVRFAIVKDAAGRTVRAYGVNQDITERRQADEALRISEERFRSALNHSPIGMAIVAPDGRFTDVNPALCNIVGYSRDELVRTRFQAITHPDDLSRDLDLVQQLLDRKIEAFQVEKRYIHKRGYVIWTQQNLSLVRDEYQRPRYFVKQVQDITERKRAAAELLALNERYARHETALSILTRSHVNLPAQLPLVMKDVTEVVARTLDVARVGVWCPADQSGDYECLGLFDALANRHIQGPSWTADETRGYARLLTAAEVNVSYDVDHAPAEHTFANEFLRDAGVTSVMDVPIRSQGKLVGVMGCGHVGEPRRWTPDEQTFTVAVANLLSSLISQVEQQKLEEQLRQSQKLEGIGQLAGGVAHDFNNVLTVILGKAGQLAEDRRLPGELREAAEEISHSGQRAANLTRQLLAFSRRQSMQKREVDLNAALGSLARMLERILGEHLAVRFSFTAEPAVVRADPGMIDQVVLNLAVNARDAMPGGGQLLIETVLVDLEGSTSAGSVHQAGAYVCLRVTDTGSGIRPEHLPHIFEPFFTTKDVGKGTGLGLATSYGIVQQHEGWIEVDSELGSGTTFSVFLPRLAGQLDPPLAVPRAPAVGARPATIEGQETILVVEDEEAVRSLIVEALRGFGYQVFEAPSGPEAITVWREHGSAVDLLITDMVMPGGVNGLDLAFELKRENPTLGVIYISGYLADVSRDEMLKAEGAAYLGKPFSLPALIRLVRERLDAVTRAS